MREILGDVLGSNFKGVTLKGYNKALKKVEDKEDYETGKQTLRDNEEHVHAEEEELEEDSGPVDQIIDMDKISSALPSIYIYGLKMIEGYSGNFDAFKEEEEDPAEKRSKSSDDSRDSDGMLEEGADFDMRPPQPLDRATTANVIREEKVRFQKYYGFA